MKWFDREKYMKEVADYFLRKGNDRFIRDFDSARHAFWDGLKDIMEKHEDISARTSNN